MRTDVPVCQLLECFHTCVYKARAKVHILRMVPCTLLRKLSFLLWYTALQFLVAYFLDALVLGTTMSLGLVAAGTQTVWLMCTYLFVFALGVHTQFASASEEEKLDEKARESEASGGQPPARKDDESAADHLMASGLSMLLVVMLAHWFALFASAMGTLYAAGDGMVRSLWGSTGAWSCVWVLFVMQTQLVVSTYLMTMHYTHMVPLSTGLQMSVALYSLCHAFLLLSLCAQEYDVKAAPSCAEGGNATTASPCAPGAERATQAENAEYVTRTWLENTKLVILYIVAATCIAADFCVNGITLIQTIRSAEATEPPDKRYLKIGLLWIAMFSALVIVSMSDLGAYALVVLLPMLVLVAYVSWHNYKAPEAPSFFTKKPTPTPATPAKPGDAFDAAASSAATGSSSSLARPGPMPRQRHAITTITADIVHPI